VSDPGELRGERFVEGRIELLLETGNGELVVVDHESDRVDSDGDVTATVEHDRPRLTAYGEAIGRGTGRSVASCVLLFAGHDEARQVDVERAPAHGTHQHVPTDAGPPGGIT
jgi:hypothetical protein